MLFSLNFHLFLILFLFFILFMLDFFLIAFTSFSFTFLYSSSSAAFNIWDFFDLLFFNINYLLSLLLYFIFWGSLWSLFLYWCFSWSSWLLRSNLLNYLVFLALIKHLNILFLFFFLNIFKFWNSLSWFPIWFLRTWSLRTCSRISFFLWSLRWSLLRFHLYFRGFDLLY